MAQIPNRRLSETELDELRARNAFSVRPPIQQIKNQALHPLFIGLGYLLCCSSIGLSIYKLSVPALVCAGIVLLYAILIFWKKPRSAHHAALMTIISLLVLVFGSVYYFAQFEQTANDPQGPIRY